MDRKIRIGIIGCGGVANGKHMPNLAKLEQAEMVAFCDIVPEKAKAAAEKYGIPDSRVFTDYHDMAALQDVDVVHVCTPNISHAEISIAMLESGKHVMCEKPMAKTYAEAKAMCEAARRTGKKLSIGYQFRSLQNVQHLKKLIEQDVLGHIYYARVSACRRRGVPTWGVFLDKEAQGGGCLIDIATHTLDMVLWLMNNYEPVRVVGVTYDYLKQTKGAANDWGPWDPEKFNVEDSAFGFITFKNGATIILECSWAINCVEVSQTVLCGTKAGADLVDGVRINGEINGALYVNKMEMSPKIREKYRGMKLTEFEYEQRQWIDSIIEDTEPLVLPEQAAVVSRILEAIYISAETGQPVVFED